VLIDFLMFGFSAAAEAQMPALDRILFFHIELDGLALVGREDISDSEP